MTASSSFDLKVHAQSDSSCILSASSSSPSSSQAVSSLCAIPGLEEVQHSLFYAGEVRRAGVLMLTDFNLKMARGGALGGEAANSF